MYRYTLQWLIAILFVLIANPAHAVVDAFLCITDPGYKGETTVTGFTNCADLTDFGQTGFIDGSTPIARDIKLDKFYDSMSNPLRTAMVSLTTLNEVKIRVTQSGGGTSPVEFLDLRLIGAHVDSAAMSWNSVSGVARPTETIGFSAASIEVKYTPISPTGMLGTPIYTCWNVAANSATNNPCP